MGGLRALLLTPLHAPRWLRSGRVWLSLGAAVLVASVVVAGWAVSGYLTEAGEVVEALAADERALLTRHASGQRERLARLGRDPFFARVPGTADAAPVLGQRVGWDTPPAGLRGCTGAECRKQFLEVLRSSPSSPWPAGVEEALRTEFAGLPAPSEVLGLDTDWLAELEAFDHWDAMQDPAATQSLGDLQESLPAFSQLALWAKARLWQGRDLERFAERAREVRQLAWLEVTTGSLVGLESGLSLLRRIHRMTPGNFQPDVVPSIWNLDEAHRVVWYRISALTVCRSGCEGVSLEPLPPALECVAVNEAFRIGVLEAWLAGEDLPDPVRVQGCSPGLQSFLIGEASRAPLRRVAPQGWRAREAFRVALGSALANRFAPDLVRPLEARLARVAVPFSAAKALEDPAR